MKYNELLILLILLVMLILVIVKIIRKENFQNNNSESNSGETNYFCYEHNSDFHNEECTSYPFNDAEGEYNCSSPKYVLSAFDHHIQTGTGLEDIQPVTDFIHMVYPKDPCCIRTCINDFTFTKENLSRDDINYDNKIGTLKNIDKNFFYASGCNLCLKNFKIALKRLNNPDLCDEAINEDDNTASACNI